MQLQYTETTPSEIEELRAFLIKSFNLPDTASTFSEQIMLWKFFARDDELKPKSFIMRDVNGNICAHCGANYTRIYFPNHEGQPLLGTFPFDWVSLHPRGGVKLLNLAMENSDILYVMGGTDKAYRALKAIRCKHIMQIPIKRKFVSYQSSIKQGLLGGGTMMRRGGRSLRNLLLTINANKLESSGFSLQPISKFNHSDMHLKTNQQSVHTVRTPAQLNHLLTHPAGSITAWRIFNQEVYCGYAVFTLSEQDGFGYGKITYFEISETVSDKMDLIISLLTNKLGELGADLVVCLACTKQLQDAFENNHFHNYGSKRLLLRAKGLEGQPSYYFTFIEADLGYG